MQYSSFMGSDREIHKDDELLHKLGGVVRNRRESLGKTRRELARGASLSERFLADVERGHANPSVLRLANLAAALEIPLVELIRAASPTDRIRTVALLGLRGAGKSTIGSMLAERLRCPLIELDAKVEEALGLRLSEIFELHGASYYRDAEREVLAEVLAAPHRQVLATGGGIVTESQTYRMLRQSAYTVWLRARPEDHWARVVAQGDTRPMEGNERAFAHLCSILADREKLYQQADLTVDTWGSALAEICDELAATVQRSAVASAEIPSS